MQTVPVLCLSDAREDTARSIKERSITTVSLNADFFNEEVIEYCEALESITTLILSNKVLDRFSVIRPNHRYETTECLFAVHRVHIFKGRTEFEFAHSLPVFPNLRELHLHKYNSFDVDLKTLSCLPNLRHFDFRGVEPADDITLFEHDSEDGYEETLHDLPPGGLQKLERMAGMSIVLFNQPGIATFVKNLPMLKHFKIKNLQLCCDESAGQILSLESLELLGLRGNKWDEFMIFLRCIPNLRASEFASCRMHGLDLRLHSLATACPRLTVIKLTNIRTLNEEVLKRIVFEVKQLQVLEVRLHSGDLKQLSDGAVSNLLGNATSIISLLGI